MFIIFEGLSLKQIKKFSEGKSPTLNDTSINMNITYANLIITNPLLKQICKSVTSVIWKQKKTIWTTEVPILNWMDIHQRFMVKFWNMTAMKNLEFSLQQYTLANLNFCWLLKLFFWSPIHSSILDWKKHSFTITMTTQAFTVSNHLC